ncbi:MAG TPA: HigA family addiction module antitoxin [Pseudacidobacterium sp.]|nr:HigA family addiction module antitoxin [Pseudacidobacterium sp.]
MKMLNPVHPGRILKLSLGSMDISEAAARLKIARPTLSKIINGRAGISADMALRLEAFFGNPSEFWMDLQKQYELAQARRRKRPKIQPMKAA